MATFTLIQTVSVGSSGASSIQFSSIPSTYTDLKIVGSLRNSGSNNWATMIFNGSAANFSMKNLLGNNNTASTQSVSNYIYTLQENTSSDLSNVFSCGDIYIPNYTSTSDKAFIIDSVRETNSTSTYELFLWGGLYTSSSAISSIEFTTNGSGNFVQYSIISLYGISKS